MRGWVLSGPAAGGAVTPVGTRTGQFYSMWPHAGLTTSLGFTNNRLVACPVTFARGGTIDRVGVDVTLAGNAGSVIRFGFAADDGNFAPASVLADFGTQDGTVAGFNPVTTAFPAASGRLYWLLWAVQSAATTIPTLRSYQSEPPHSLVGSPTGGGAPSRGGYFQDSVSGALGASFTFTATQSVAATAIPAIWFRFA